MASQRRSRSRLASNSSRRKQEHNGGLPGVHPGQSVISVSFTGAVFAKSPGDKGSLEKTASPCETNWLTVSASLIHALRTPWRAAGPTHPRHGEFVGQV